MDRYTVTDMCVDLAGCLETLEQDLVVQYQYHYSTDNAWYLILHAYLGNSIIILTQIDKVLSLPPANNKNFGIRYLVSKIMPTYLNWNDVYQRNKRWISSKIL